MDVSLRSGTTLSILVTWYRVVPNRGGGVHHIDWLGDGPNTLAFIDFSEIVAVVSRRMQD